MSFHHLSHNDLIANFSDLVQKERQITAQVLACIAEIDRRKLYLEKGYSSLFDFLVRDYGYSPGAAMRRVDGARLLRELPDVKDKIERGSLTLSQANQIQRAAREMKKAERALSTEEKQELILQIEHANKKETEKILAERLNLPMMPIQKETLHRDASVTLTMTFSAEQIEMLEQVRYMVSHAVNSQNWSELCVYLAKKELVRRTKTRSTNSRSTNSKSTNTATPSNSNVAATVKKRSALPARVRKTLLNTDARCQYKNHKGEQCYSSRFLQIDHIQSVSCGGSNDIENLQILCGTHNRYKYARGS